MTAGRKPHRSWAWSLLPLLCAAGGGAWALSEFGIEGMHVVSTRAGEVRGTVAPDGQRIVWSSDREGGAGGWDLWQATLVDGRWQNPAPLPFNGARDEVEPAFSSDGRWLYFASDRKGGRGGLDLYRVAVRGRGFGEPESLGDAVNTKRDERSPFVTADGATLLFASDGHGGEGGLDLYAAAWGGAGLGAPVALPEVNTPQDELDPVRLGSEAGAALLFARGVAGQRSGAAAPAGPMQLQLARATADGRIGITPLALSFNTPGAHTRGAMPDWHKPGELLVSGSARAPRAGGSDLYRMKAPAELRGASPPGSSAPRR